MNSRPKSTITIEIESENKATYYSNTNLLDIQNFTAKLSKSYDQALKTLYYKCKELAVTLLRATSHVLLNN